MIFAMPNKPGEFSRFDFPELPAPINGKQPSTVKACSSFLVIIKILFSSYGQFGAGETDPMVKLVFRIV